MKKMLTFMIMLMVGIALFAVPLADELDTSSVLNLNTAEIVPQQADVFTVVTDVFPVIVPVENLCRAVVIKNYFHTTPDRTKIDMCLHNKEAALYFGYSKTMSLRMNNNIISLNRRI